MSVATKKPEFTPAQRLAASRRAEQLRTGEVVIPLACPSCYSPSLEAESSDNGPMVRCVSCGRPAKESVARTVRRQRLRRFLLDGGGVDVR